MPEKWEEEYEEFCKSEEDAEDEEELEDDEDEEEPEDEEPYDDVDDGSSVRADHERYLNWLYK
jgi:hypothetical protein